MASKTLLVLLVSMLFIEIKSNEVGFSAGMIHRDSPHSPYYDHSITRYERVTKAISRSFARHSYVASMLSAKSSASQTSFGTVLFSDQGEYLMRIVLGTPGVEILAIVDTGSTLIWTQCEPCNFCYRQIPKIFDPKASSSYKIVKCTNPRCQYAGNVRCGLFDLTCRYVYSYGDGSFTSGNLATDVLSFPSLSNGVHTSFPDVYFGCGTRNSGSFSPRGSGLVGLGNSSISLINQLNISKFSYCLPYIFSNVECTISFGSSAQINGPNVTSTSLFTRSSSNYPFYYLNFLGFTIGSTTITSPISANNSNGNIIIDSGTTLTYLPTDLVNRAVNILQSSITCPRATNVEASQGLELCYNTKNCHFSVPTIVANFGGGSIVLPSANTFLEIQRGVKCLTFVGTNNLYIWGNTAQMNFRIEYDLSQFVLKFQPSTCCGST